MDAMIETPTDTVRVVYGASDGWFPLVGRTVRDVGVALAGPFGVPEDALAFLDGEPVEASYVLVGNDTLEFVVLDGVKGALEPHEQAQLDRMEALLSRLVCVQGHATKPLAAPKRPPGRKPETLEIAEYANELRLQGKTWKEVLTACKKRWLDDRRVRNARQIRATWNRHFGPKRNRH